jgi:drug/metabolite transporter (DMT)-like permease
VDQEAGALVLAAVNEALRQAEEKQLTEVATSRASHSARPHLAGNPGARAAELSLLGVAFMFGLTFVLTQQAIERLPVTTFLAYRFLPAAVLVGLLCGAELRRLPLAGWRAGLVIGVLLAAGNVFQATALEHTSASTAGLITGLFVIATPLLGWGLLRMETSRATWIASAVCIAGLALLSGGGGGTVLGDCLALLAALSFGGHILALGTLGRHHPPGPVATLQLAVGGVVFLVAAALTGGLTMPQGTIEWRAIAVTSIGCGAIAFIVQTRAQRRVAPARAAVILAGEPAFAALTGWLMAGDRISLSGWLGAALMLGAVFYVASRSDATCCGDRRPLTAQPARR